jgi:hypothetical protein
MMNRSTFRSVWRGMVELLSVRVPPFVYFPPLLDSIPSKLRIKYVGIASAHDFFFIAKGRVALLSVLFFFF